MSLTKETKQKDTIVIEKQLVGVAVDRNGNKVKTFFLKVNGKDYHVTVTSHLRLEGTSFYVAVDVNAPKFDDLENQGESEGYSFISEDEAIKDLFS